MVYSVKNNQSSGFLFLDFEFYDSEKAKLSLVCGAYSVDGKMFKNWLYADQRAKETLADVLESYRKSHTFVAYGVGAEARALSALGLDPLAFKWRDLLLDWKALRNCHPKYLFGRFIKKGQIVEAAPPRRKGDSVEGMAGLGLVDCTAALLGRVISSEHKDSMRERILRGGPYSAKWADDILDYCAEDVEVLPDLLNALMEAQPEEYGAAGDNPVVMHPVTREKAAAIRGRWAADIAVIESEGMPLDMDFLWQVSKKASIIQDRAIRECNEVYPFFSKGKGAKAKWVKKYDLFDQWVREAGYEDLWPLSEKSKKFKCDEDTLSDFRGCEEIETLRQTLKTIQQVNWFRPEAMLEFLKNVGPDGRIRPYFNPYGTQTGRNAPPARSFPLAMASWVRAAINPPEGWVITGRDYGAQEVALAAAMSADGNLIDAYNSGDPYIWFAVEAKAAPKGATKSSHSDVREAFKSTKLGVGYGMGDKSLALKLTVDTRRKHSVEEAARLISLHQNIFPDYWDWRERVWEFYRRKRQRSFDPLCLCDGWPVWGGNFNPRSIQNLPVQGTAQVVLRYATRLCHDEGVRIIAPLHDALYALHHEEDKETPEILEHCMNKAWYTIMGEGIKIRSDEKQVFHGEHWVEKKGAKMYKLIRSVLDE